MNIPKIILMGVSLNHMSAKGEATLCAEDYHVVNHACVPCPSGQSNMPGDDPTGHDTSCDTCKITTNQELRDYVDSWIAIPSSHPCGPVIGDWEVGRVTDMSYVFCAYPQYSQCNTNRSNFNANISNWNTVSVIVLRMSTFVSFKFCIT